MIFLQCVLTDVPVRHNTESLWTGYTRTSNTMSPSSMLLSVCRMRRTQKTPTTYTQMDTRRKCSSNTHREPSSLGLCGQGKFNFSDWSNTTDHQPHRVPRLVITQRHSMVERQFRRVPQNRQIRWCLARHERTCQFQHHRSEESIWSVRAKLDQ